MLTTYDVAYDSGYLSSYRWSSLIMDAPSASMQPSEITSLYNIGAKHKILITEGKSSTLDKTELTLFSSLSFGCVSRDLNYFALGLSLSKIPRDQQPRKYETQVRKCPLSSRQKIIYHNILDLKKGDLDSMDTDRVLPSIYSLLRVCNHADFRSVNKRHSVARFNFERLNMEGMLNSYPKLIQDLICDTVTKKFDNLIHKSENVFSWNQNLSFVNQDSPGIVSESLNGTNGAKILVIKPDNAKLLLKVDKFGSSIFSNTVQACKFKINQQKAKRKGQFHFMNRIRPENTNRFPWAGSPTLISLGSIGENKHKEYTDMLNQICALPEKIKDKADKYATSAPIIGPYSGKLEQLRKELELPVDYRPNMDTLGVLFCCRSDEVGELLRTYFLHSLNIESIFIQQATDRAQKITKIHEYNYTRSTKALIYNIRSGSLPLVPQKIQKVIIYEEELYPESLDIFEEETIPRINPATVVKLISENTIEEKIKNFQPKITANSTRIHGVHSLLIDTDLIPFEHHNRPHSKRSHSPTWQQLLFKPDEINVTDTASKAEKLEQEAEEETDYSDYSDEDDLEDELTSIEQYAMDIIRFEDQDETVLAKSLQSHNSEHVSYPDHIEKTETVCWPKEDLFISSIAAEEVCVDQKGEALPIWTPPTPPHQEEFRQEVWKNNYEENPMNIISAAMKRFKVENVIHQKSEYDIPISFFNRNSKQVATPRQKHGVVRPPQHNLFTGQKWLIDEEYTLTWCMEDQMPITTHQPNWEMVASAINCFIGLYRSPMVTRQQYDTSSNFKEEGKYNI